MDMDKNIVLAQSVAKFPCLYKSDSIEYLRKPLTERAWLKISKETNLTVQECKERWKHLRYGLVRSLRPSRHGLAKKKYYLHNNMKFLIPYLGTSGTNSNEKTIQHDEEFEDFHDEVHENPLEDDKFNMTHVVETYISDDEESINKKPKINETQHNHVEHENQTQPYTFEEDPRRMFLLSLLPEIADFSENQMKTFRRRIYGLLDEINKDPT
ncbi:uncharacterized protein LOC123874436 [Maniola jurtina]|uniref:uncharacterized protein LOC123874436 n=1 Tax=Maniola jurtina TaxID=191418 RepID=UPI001E68923D|nr:uncharacterized protein LOC123874436 [Maniola jurtina]